MADQQNPRGKLPENMNIEQASAGSDEAWQSARMASRKSLCMAVSGLAATVIACFSINYMFHGQLMRGLTEAVMAVLCVGVTLMVWRTNRTRGPTSFLMAVGALLLTFLLITGGTGGTGIYWIYFYPLLAFHLAGRRGGLFWTTVFVGVVALAVLLHLWGYIPFFYEIKIICFAFFSFGITVILSCFFESKIEQDERVMLGQIQKQKQAEEAMRNARDAAEMASRAKSSFLANMSHEIRTPLNAVIGLTELLRDTQLDIEQRDHVETINSSGEALLVLINDILDFSKVEAGELVLEKHSFDVHEGVHAAMELLAPVAEKKGLEMVCLIDDDVPPYVLGDVVRVRQVLSNLLSNAVKFTKEGEILVSVSALSKTEKHCELKFEVKDTGIGLNAQQQEDVFGAFKQADSSTTRKYGGTGLGLSICRRLAELMDGRIDVESEIGVGSTFFFTINVEISHEPPPAFLRPTPPVLLNKHVLIVDDNATNRQILHHHLGKWGMICSSVDSGMAALKLLAQKDERVDLVVLDMHMPEMDGLQLAREIRRDQDRSGLPLVMLTSIGDIANFDRSLLSDCLCKPVKPSLLYGAIIRAFAEESLSQTSADVSVAEEPPDLQEKPRRSLHALLVEDNLVNQKVAEKMLAKLGHESETVSNGLEAIHAVKRQQFDVILMDVQMPEMDGLEATRRIRAMKSDVCTTPIIGMTAHALASDRERCLSAGMDRYVSKPIRLEQLAEVLGTLPARIG